MKLSALTANATVKALGQSLNNGRLQLLEGNVVLAELRFAADAFKEPAEGRAESHPLLSDPDARTSGKATNYIMLTEGGDPVSEGTVSDKEDGAADLIIKAINIQRHAEIVVDSVTLEA